MVSYFEDIPREMEEAAFLDRAGRFRTLWYIILPQVRGGIAVTVIFVFLNAWNEFLFAVLLGGTLSVAGLAISYGPDLPAGPTIILLAGAVYVGSALYVQFAQRRRARVSSANRVNRGGSGG